MTNQIHPDHRKVAIAWALVVLSICLYLCSCSPSKKAHDYFAKNEKEFAQDCADAFPVVPVIDSTGYKESLKIISGLADQLNADSVKDAQDMAWYNAEINRLEKTAPPDCDSLSDAIYRLAAKEKGRADSLEKRCRQIADAAKNVKPVNETKVDVAKLQACEQREDKLRADLSIAASALTKAVIRQSETESERDEWKASAKKRWWVCLWLIAAIIAIVLHKPIINLIKSIFMKTLIPLFVLFLFGALASCGHFHDDPKVSVWADGLWIVPVLLFGGAVFFAIKAVITHNSGSNKIDAGAITNKEGGKVPYTAVSWTKWAAALLIIGIIVVAFMNSKCNK